MPRPEGVCGAEQPCAVPADEPMLHEVPPSEGSAVKITDFDADGSGSEWLIDIPINPEGHGDRMLSPCFRVGGAVWQMWLRVPVPRPGYEAVGLFVVCRTAEERASMVPPDVTWSIWAAYQLQVLRSDSTASRCQRTEHRHRFSSDGRTGGTDWGYNELMQVRDLHRYVFPLPNGGECFRLKIIMKDLTEHSAPVAVGGVGLQNQGATCYLNSLLQTLFHLRVFREATFRLPIQFFRRQQQGKNTGDITIDEGFRKTLPFALAKVFWGLLHSDEPVSTTALTKSFGWARRDTAEQQDVQELLRKLTDNLEEKMKATSLEGFVDRLLMGKMRNFVKCTHVDFESERVESFYDVQVNVKGNASLEDALRELLEKEDLDGENKYHAADEERGVDHGRQDAQKGMEWLSFPPVLFLHLRRFDYDYVHDMPTKVNGRFTFPPMLNMRQFLRTESSIRAETPQLPKTPLLPPLTPGAAPVSSQDPPIEPISLGPSMVVPDHAELEEEDDDEHTYLLHSVLVHSGTVHGGHYYAFIRSSQGWFRYDDDTVTVATEVQAVVENFGGTSDRRFWLRNSEGSGTSAYMLVYIDARRWGAMTGTGAIAIPKQLECIFKAEAEEEERKRLEREEAPTLVDVEVCTSDVVRAYVDSEEFQTDLRSGGLLPREQCVRVRRATPWPEFVAIVAEHLRAAGCEKATAGNVCMWPFLPRENATTRPGSIPLPSADEQPHRSVESVLHVPRALRKDPRVARFSLYAECFEQRPDEGTALIFVKRFDEADRKPGQLRFLDTLLVHMSTPIAAVCGKINGMLYRPHAAPLGLWEEVRQSLAKEVVTTNPTALLASLIEDLGTGDIIVAEPLEEGHRPADERWTPKRALRWQGFRLDLQLLDIENPVEPTTVTVQLDDTLADVAKAVAEAVSCELSHLRLTQRVGHVDEEISWQARGGDRIDSVIRGTVVGGVLRYERLPMPVDEVRKLLEVKIEVWGDPRTEPQVLKLIFPRDATVRDARNAVREKAPDVAWPMDAVRVRKHRLHAVVGDGEFLRDVIGTLTYGEPYQLRLQPPVDGFPAVPRGEHAEADMELVSVCHWERLGAVQCHHSEPFLMYAVRGESRDDFMTRLAAVIGVGYVEKVKAWGLSVMRASAHQSSVLCHLELASEDVFEALARVRQRHGLGGGDLNHSRIFSYYLGIEHRNLAHDVLPARGVEIKG
eukprot:TRINITY_DN4493_c3_g1_i1.p1 TRINITY_DN4493_c3_g1~~TRINITY_DN4493_c3_g1_i1.p1  ORF type:complete len:1199 (+),score=313.80 TRINITY_DN4493_c3_g1_i1:153-3749(+)